MVMVASRELRNHTVAVLDRVRAGEPVQITVHGAIVAELHPVERRKAATLHRNQLIAHLTNVRPDSALATLHEELTSETTDEL